MADRQRATYTDRTAADEFPGRQEGGMRHICAAAQVWRCRYRRRMPIAASHADALLVDRLVHRGPARAVLPACDPWRPTGRSKVTGRPSSRPSARCCDYSPYIAISPLHTGDRPHTGRSIITCGQLPCIRTSRNMPCSKLPCHITTAWLLPLIPTAQTGCHVGIIIL